MSYINGILPYLVKSEKHKFLIITDSKFGSWNIEGVEEIVVSSTNPLYWFYWSNFVLPKILKEKKVDIYHTLKHITAFFLKTKNIVSIHGIHTHYFVPQYFKWYDTIYWKLTCWLAVKKYDRILTAGNGEKNYLVEKVGYPAEKFSVTHQGADISFRVITDKNKLLKIKEKYNLPDRYLLFAGKINPIKNIESIIRSYQKVKSEVNSDYKLVLTGNDKNEYGEKLKNLVKDFKLENEVIFLGFIPYEDLSYVFNLARVFVFPSSVESFGIASIEAMSCGLPVISSDIPEINEVVGDAGILVNPKETDEIAEAIKKIILSDDFRLELSKKSLERACLFSWENCANATLKVYEDVMSPGNK